MSKRAHKVAHMGFVRARGVGVGAGVRRFGKWLGSCGKLWWIGGRWAKKLYVVGEEVRCDGGLPSWGVGSAAWTITGWSGIRL